MDRTVERVSFTLAEAAIATGIGELTIRRALKATDPAVFPPPLVGAKRAGDGPKASYIIPADALRAWVDSFPDA